jgi:hypothetical protein
MITSVNDPNSQKAHPNPASDQDSEIIQNTNIKKFAISLT